MNISEAIIILKNIGSKNPARDIRYLWQELNGNAQIPNENQELTKDFEELIIRLIYGEPIDYILGNSEFYGLKFLVNKDVLIPRDDTETIIDIIRKNYKEDKRLNIIDLGTGSGAIIITLLNIYKNAFGVGVDISKPALRIARKNAISLGVDERLDLTKSNWFDNVNNIGFDIIISNPPYIAKDDKDAEESLKYEPQIALWANDNGLLNYKVIIKEAEQYLNENGIIVLEIGHKQAEDVSNIGINAGYSAKVYKDLAGLDRVVVLKSKKAQH